MGKPLVIDGETWIKSKARKMLFEDIVAGRVTATMDPDAVHKSRPEFFKWPRRRFVPNLESLKAQIARDYSRMLKDLEYYQHDVEKLKDQRLGDPPSKIPWHKSEAKKLLEQEIDNGVLEQDPKPTPSKMYNGKAEYQQFTLDQFRNHIYQEVKRREKIESKARFGKKKMRNPQETVRPELLLLVKEQAKKTPRKKSKAKETPKPAIKDIVSKNAYAQPKEAKAQKTASRRSTYGRKPASLKKTTKKL
jgi:hypothetical protein